MRTIETLLSVWPMIRTWVTNTFRPSPVPMPIASPDRAELFVQLAAVRAQRAAEAEAHRIAVADLTGQWTIIQAQADDLHHQLNTLQRTDFCASLDASADEDALLRQIQEKSSMSVQLFITEMDDELDILNRTEETIVPTAHRDYSLVKKVMGLSTDACSRHRRAAALHQARQRARQMQLEELSVEQMNTELLRLKKTLPAVEHEVLHSERASIAAYN